MLRKPGIRILTALVLFAAALLVGQPPASAGAGLSATSGYLGTTTSVGSSFSITLRIENLNTPPDTTLTLGPILFVPSCGTSGPVTNDCPAGSADPDVVSVAQDPTGASGTACAGLTFEITPSNAATGRVELTPSSPIALAAPNASDSDTCLISFEVSVERSPSIDSRPGVPGLQTDGFTITSGTSSSGVRAVASGGSNLTIEPAATAITTSVVDAEVALGEPVGDVAVLAAGHAPTGELAFDLYGPDDTDCTGPPAATVTTPVDGTGPYSSATTIPTEPGEYRYIARYGGDTDNLPASGSCNDPNETVVVAAAEPPGIRVTLDATPLSRPEPGGTFSFDASVTNTSAVPVTITGLQDDVYGDVTGKGTCTDAIGTVLDPGDAYTCAYPGDLTGNAGTTQTDVLTGGAVDGAGDTVLDEDDATVALTDVPPTVTVSKTALPEERAAPGGLFTFAVAITNTSFEGVTVTRVEDDVYGDLAHLTSSSCAPLVAQALGPGEAVTCTFTGELTGSAGAAQTDVVTVTVTDDDGSVGTGKDDATVRLVPSGTTPTTAPPTTAPRTAPTSAPRPGTPSLVSTGSPLRSTAALGLALLGSGMLITGVRQRREPWPLRHRSP